MIKIEDFYFDNILLDKKSYENILTYDISHGFQTGLLELMLEINI